MRFWKCDPFFSSNSWLEMFLPHEMNPREVIIGISFREILIISLIYFQKSWELPQNWFFSIFRIIFTLNLIQIYLKWWFLNMNHTNILMKDMMSLGIVDYLPVLSHNCWKLSQKWLFIISSSFYIFQPQIFTLANASVEVHFFDLVRPQPLIIGYVVCVNRSSHKLDLKSPKFWG